MTSMTIAPAPRAARFADAAVISAMTPATIICKPPPALDVEMYMSQPSLPSDGFLMVPSSFVS